MKAYIITGAPGAGKTEIIEKLSQRGYIGLEEIPRKLLHEKTAEKLGISPFSDLEKFAHLVFEEMYKQYLETIKKDDSLCFFDRGIPDVFAYLENSKIPIPNKYYTKLDSCNFEKDVFICPPWKEIYMSDSIRPYPFEETIKLHQQIVSIYKRLNFNLIEIPKLPIPQRVDFVIAHINYQPETFNLI
jgi:predicted ATPase